MPQHSQPVAHSRRRARHGRALRSAVTGRYLTPLHTRQSEFELIVSQTAGYVRSLWPEEMATVTIALAQAPEEAIHEDHIDRWVVDHERRIITLFRVPIARFDHRQGDDALHDRMVIEGYVFRAIAELLGKEPWDIARHRYGR